jgi:hypothetical protein
LNSISFWCAAQNIDLFMMLEAIFAYSVIFLLIDKEHKIQGKTQGFLVSLANLPP